MRRRLRFEWVEDGQARVFEVEDLYSADEIAARYVPLWVRDPRTEYAVVTDTSETPKGGDAE